MLFRSLPLRAGTKWESASSDIKGTPWLYAMEIPERAALAPARALLLPFLITGLVIALTATVLGRIAGQTAAALAG